MRINGIWTFILKKYITFWRALFLCIWVLALILAPSMLIYFNVIPGDTALYPMAVLFPLIGLILFKKTSIRIGVIILVLLAFFNLFRASQVDLFLNSLDHRVRSAFFELRGPEKPSRDVVVIDIDNASLVELGQWPWPRTHLAKAISNLTNDGVKVIGLDIVFPNEDHQSLKHFSDTLSLLGLEFNWGVPEEKGKIFLNGQQIENIVVREYARSDEFDKTEKELNDGQLRESVISTYKKKHVRMLDDEIVLLEIGRHSHALLYIDTDWNDPIIFHEGAYLIMDNDQKLSETFSNNPVVGGGWIEFPLSAAGMISKVKGPQAKPFEGMVLGTSLQSLKESFPNMKKGIGQVLNNSVLQEGLNYQGAFNIIPEPSGSARYYSLAIQAKYFMEALVFVAKDFNSSRLDDKNYEKKIVSEDFVYPSLALEMLRVGEGFHKVQAKKNGGLNYLELANDRKSLQIPVTKQVEIPINFLGFGGKWEPYYTDREEYFFPYYSFADVLKGRFSKGVFKDKYVVVGSTDPTLSDLIGSPFRAGFPGVEVHATMIDNILSDAMLADYDHVAREWKYFGLVLFGFILVLALSRLGPAWGGFISVGILILIPVVAYFLMSFGEGRFIYSFSYEWFSVLILSSIVLMSGYFETSQDRKFLQDQFGSMVSPRVLAKLQADPKMQSLKGMKSEVTVTFSDIADFTTISESLSPQKLVRFLNEYFTPMTKIILDEQGYIDKFIGDAIMSCWGVPFSQKNHQIRACRAVVKQNKCIEELKLKLERDFHQPLKVRFGIASGIVSSAMVGSADRKNYTVLGDVVNTAARLEPLGKVYGVSIIVSHLTYEHAKDEFIFRMLDSVIVKGKHKPVNIYELMGEVGDVSEDEMQIKELYERAFAHYLKREWDLAINSINKVLILNPADLASENLKKRMEKFIKEPPPLGWKGEEEYFQK